jgi:hypothetical protein
VLFAVGLGATAGILVAPASSGDDKPSDARAIVILVDARSILGSQNAETLGNENLERVVQEVLEEGRGLRFAVYVSGENLRLAVPDTVDGQGVLVMIGGLQPDRGPAARGSLRRSIEALAKRRRDDKVRMTLIVISGQSAEDLAMELHPSGAPTSRIMVARLPGRGFQREFGTSGGGGAWNWSEDRGQLRRFLAEPQPVAAATGEWRQRLFAVPYLAGLALVLAAAECVLVLVVPLYSRG